MDHSVAVGMVERPGRIQAEADEKLAEFTANIDEKIDASPTFGHGLRGGTEDDDGDGTSSGTQFRSRSRT